MREYCSKALLSMDYSPITNCIVCKKAAILAQHTKDDTLLYANTLYDLDTYTQLFLVFDLDFFTLIFIVQF